MFQCAKNSSIEQKINSSNEPKIVHMNARFFEYYVRILALKEI